MTNELIIVAITALLGALWKVGSLVVRVEHRITRMETMLRADTDTFRGAQKVKTWKSKLRGLRFRRHASLSK